MVDENAVDIARLAEWMDGQGLERGAITGLTVLAGGTQNLILRFARGGRFFVLRRPPIHPRPESNTTMRREALVLGALADTDVPHPRLIAACADEEILGVAFYLMEPVDGFNATSGLPALHAGDPAIRREMGYALVEGASALAKINHEAVGLKAFGRPDSYLERQVSRWRSQLDGYGRYHNWPGRVGLPDIERVADYLEANRPLEFRPGIMHGDYSLGNVMFRNDGPQLAAIIDWELCTIGDPLLDLGLLMANWPGVPPANLPVLKVEPWDGFPTEDELVAHYAGRTDRSMDAITWYAVLAAYKQAIILEGSFARACAGIDPVPVGKLLHETAVILIRRALARIA
jgi:aminoglycoside phosphotransferase (APT) family kinase protein